MDLNDFWQQSAQGNFARLLDGIDLGLTVDHSGYVYVDGEEGDYGVVRYLQDGRTVAIKTIYGGDEESLDVTEYGKYALVSGARN